MTVSEAVLFAAFVSPPMPLGRVVAIVNEPVTPTCQVAPNVPVETAPGAIVRPEFDWYKRLLPLLPTNVQSLDARGSVLSVLAPSMVNDSVKVIVPVVGAVPTLVIEKVKDPGSPAGRVVGPVMLGVRSGTGVVVVVVVVGGTVVVVVVLLVEVVVVGAGAAVVVVAGARAAAGALDGHEV